MRVRSCVGALLVALACGLLSAASASAKTVTVGQLFPTSGSCPADTILQTGVGIGTPYTVPKAGVITSWSYVDGPDGVTSGLKLKVGHTAPAGTYKIVGEATAGTQKANVVNTYHAHIPVKAGDVIGLYTTGVTGDCGTFTGNPGDKVIFRPGDQPVGTTASYSPPIASRISISAKVALDCVVPNLKGKTLNAAKKALKANSCALGTVTGPRTGTVKSQKPGAGKTLQPGAKVNVRLG